MKTLLYIGNKLAAHGSNLTVMEKLGPLLESEGFKVYYASGKSNKVFRMLDMCWKTLIYGRSASFVLIDTYSTQNFWFAFVTSQLCRLMGVKYIPNLHGGNLPDRLKNSPVLSRMVFENSHINVAPSGYLIKAFREAGYNRLTYIPNSIDLSGYKFTKRTSFRPKLLWVRAFSKIYNPAMAIKVMEILQRKFPDASLCMIGPDRDGSLQEIKALANSLRINATFTGKLSKAAWTSLSEDYDIFINTTHYDNTPVSVIEAMALGLPVVSTNVGGMPFLIENNKTGLLINDADHVAMATAIEALIENPELGKALSANALKLVQDFDSEKVKREWIQILR